MQKKNQQESLSNDIIKRRISLMPSDAKQQVIAEFRCSLMFAVQLDESTDIASCSKLLLFFRYIHKEDIKKEFCIAIVCKLQPQLKM